MSFGTISSMISSLKSNKSLRRNKETYSRFAKQTDFSDSNFHPISNEENQIIVEENKKLLIKKTRDKNLFALFMILFYGSILIYGVNAIFN